MSPVLGQGIPPTHSNYLRRASDIAAVKTVFNVLSYEAVSDRDHLSNEKIES